MLNRGYEGAATVTALSNWVMFGTLVSLVVARRCALLTGWVCRCLRPLRLDRFGGFVCLCWATAPMWLPWVCDALFPCPVLRSLATRPFIPSHWFLSNVLCSDLARWWRRRARLRGGAHSSLASAALSAATAAAPDSAAAGPDSAASPASASDSATAETGDGSGGAVRVLVASASTDDDLASPDHSGGGRNGNGGLRRDSSMTLMNGSSLDSSASATAIAAASTDEDPEETWPAVSKDVLRGTILRFAVQIGSFSPACLAVAVRCGRVPSWFAFLRRARFD